MPRHPRKENQPAQTTFPDPHAILLNAPRGIFTSTPEGKLFSANLTLAKLYDYETPRELIESITDIGRRLYADPGDRGRILDQLAIHGRVQDFECRLLRRDGSVFWSSIHNHKVLDETGKLTHHQGK